MSDGRRARRQTRESTQVVDIRFRAVLLTGIRFTGVGRSPIRLAVIPPGTPAARVPREVIRFTVR